MEEKRRVGKYCEVCDGKYTVFIRYNYSDACEYVQVYEMTNGTCEQILCGTFGINMHEAPAGYSMKTNEMRVFLNYITNIVREARRWLKYWEVEYEEATT